MALPQGAARRQVEDRHPGAIGLPAKRAPQHLVHQHLAWAIQEARHAAGRQERRGEFTGGGDWNHAKTDGGHPEMLGGG